MVMEQMESTFQIGPFTTPRISHPVFWRSKKTASKILQVKCAF